MTGTPDTGADRWGAPPASGPPGPPPGPQPGSRYGTPPGPPPPRGFPPPGHPPRGHQPPPGAPAPRRRDRNGGRPGPGQDDATRYLSAAAHLDSVFAGGTLREFLNDPLRAVAPSPGVDSRAVLRDAVAATVRRRWRDGALAALIVATALISLVALVIWIFLGTLWSWFGPRTHALDGRVRSRLSTAGLVVAAVVVFVGTVTQSALLAVSAGGGGTGAVRILLLLLVAVLAGAVLVVDRLAVWSLVTTTFRRGAVTGGLAARARSMGKDSGLHRLIDDLPPDAGRNVVVFRGDEPFVGWGRSLRTIPMITPLEALDGAGSNGGGRRSRPPAPEFQLSDLYDHLGESVRDFRRSSPALSPSFRLGQLEEHGTIVVPSNSLMLNYQDDAAKWVLPTLDGRPAQRIDPALLDSIADNPVEWMRYYRVFQIEAWDRQLVVSMFVHIGADRDTLYFEYTPCVLAPVSPWYQRIDSLSPSRRAAPVLDALGSLVVLPTTILGRLRRSFLLSRLEHHPAGEYSSDRYGARHSIRELGAEDTVTDYLQLRDVERYSILLRDRLFSATTDFLLSRGISPAAFMELAKTIQNNTYNIDQSNAQGSGVFLGSGGSVNNGSPPSRSGSD